MYIIIRTDTGDAYCIKNVREMNDIMEKYGDAKAAQDEMIRQMQKMSVGSTYVGKYIVTKNKNGIHGISEVKMPLSNGAALVAYANINSDYPGAGIQYQTPDGDEFDVVLVESEGEGYNPDEIRIYHYGDQAMDDWTSHFILSRHIFDTMFR